MQEHETRVLSNRTIAEGIFELKFSVPEMELALPGQFVNIATRGAYLRRPISIADWDVSSRTLTLIIQQIGAGTQALAALQTGESAQMLAPLGHGFSLGDAERVWLVGGGVGVAPLMYAAKVLKLQSRKVESFVGFRSRQTAYGLEELASCGLLRIATQDGSVGFNGLVTGILEERLASSKPDLLLCCGPTPMLRALQPLCEGLSAQVSLEERMGCAVGACLVCNCKMRDDSQAQGWSYRRVCADGPVFPLAEVIF